MELSKIIGWPHSRANPPLPICASQSCKATAKIVGIRNLVRLGHYDDVIKWKHFPRYCPFVRGIHRSPVNSPHKAQWRGALMFFFICVWINGWVNNGEVGDLRRYRSNYDVTVMTLFGPKLNISVIADSLARASAGSVIQICDTQDQNLGLTHLPPGQNDRQIADDIFRCIFREWKVLCFVWNFHWSLFRRVQFTINRHWFR